MSGSAPVSAGAHCYAGICWEASLQLALATPACEHARRFCGVLESPVARQFKYLTVLQAASCTCGAINKAQQAALALTYPLSSPGVLQNQSYGATAAEVPHDSVYAIGMNAAGTMVATGSTEVLRCQAGPLPACLPAACLNGSTLSPPACCSACQQVTVVYTECKAPHACCTADQASCACYPLQAVATVIDVRTGQGVMQLKGHTDNIRWVGEWASGRAYNEPCLSRVHLLTGTLAAGREHEQCSAVALQCLPSMPMHSSTECLLSLLRVAYPITPPCHAAHAATLPMLPMPPCQRCPCCTPPVAPSCRALQLDCDGRLLLTGSSDHTIRLWDLGQQRCVQTLAVHTDSVWALAANNAFTVVYSGGRDGCIYRHGVCSRGGQYGVRARTVGPPVSK